MCIRDSFRSSVARAGVGHDHLAEQAGGSARYQRGQRRHQDAFRFVGGDDRAQHGTGARVDWLAPYHVEFAERATRSGPKMLKLWAAAKRSCYVLIPVSYTHLTLPTIYSV